MANSIQVFLFLTKFLKFLIKKMFGMYLDVRVCRKYILVALAIVLVPYGYVLLSSSWRADTVGFDKFHNYSRRR